MSPFTPKLTTDEVRVVRTALTEGSATQTELERPYGVTRQAVFRIAHAET